LEKKLPMNPDPETVLVDLGDRSYPIEIGLSLWDRLGEGIERRFHPTRVAVISDDVVGPLYESCVSDVFGQRWRTTFHRMPAGEQHKNLAAVQALYSGILDSGCDRKTPVVALGGGVPGDTAGFVAATLLRGLPFVQVPTTLLAMVDSSVGGKTGVDMPQGKNLVGAFHQPSLVVISVDTLKSLPIREFQAGMAEVIKYGVIWDDAFFADLESRIEPLLDGDPEGRIRIIRRCCEIKAEVVSKDERESGLREILNFGHTVGHAIETATQYGDYLHGEAVAIGMMVEAAIAEMRGLVQISIRERLRALLLRTGLPVSPPECDLTRIWNLMQADKKTRGGSIRMVLPVTMGRVETAGGIEREEFEKAWNSSLE
jgi:3-dehydroquinate synthase